MRLTIWLRCIMKKNDFKHLKTNCLITVHKVIVQRSQIIFFCCISRERRNACFDVFSPSVMPVISDLY